MAGHDMGNGNGNMHFSDDARFAALSQRVSGIETSVQGLSNQFSSLVAKLDERQRTPWGLIVSVSVALLAYVTTIGGLAYAPVWASLGKHDAAIAKIQDTSITIPTFQDFRSQYENNRVVSRNEYIDKFNNITTRIDSNQASLQRQLDQLASQYSSTYGARDVILDLRERLDRVERNRPGIP